MEGGGGGRRVRGRGVWGDRDSEWEGGTREPGFRYEASKLAQCVERVGYTVTKASGCTQCDVQCDAQCVACVWLYHSRLAP